MLFHLHLVYLQIQGLKWDQYNCGIGPGGSGGSTGCAGGTAGCAGGAGWLHRRNGGTTGGITGGQAEVWNGPASAISIYVIDKIDCVTRNEFNSIPNNIVTD